MPCPYCDVCIVPWGEARRIRARDGIYCVNCVNCVKNEGDTLLLFDFACYNIVIDLEKDALRPSPLQGFLDYRNT